MFFLDSHSDDYTLPLSPAGFLVLLHHSGDELLDVDVFGKSGGKGGEVGEKQVEVELGGVTFGGTSNGGADGEHGTPPGKHKVEVDGLDGSLEAAEVNGEGTVHSALLGKL